jgi:hypothetical protein
MRADAKHHPECKDRARREKERLDAFEPWLRDQIEAGFAESDRIRERVDELLARWRTVNDQTKAAIASLDVLYPPVREPFWKRLWRLAASEPTLDPDQDGPEAHKGRTGAQNGGSDG